MSQSSDDFRPDDAISDLDLDAELSNLENNVREHATDAATGDLQAEVDQLKDRALRAQAEFENYRRRVQREMQEERRYSAQPVLTDLLPVLDNMERAIEAAQQSEGGAGLLEGFKLVRQQMLSILEKHNCTPIPADGQVFDPTLHQAILQTPSNEVEAGRVIQVSQHGYQLNGRVIRPSQVIVSSGPTT
ncbi:MAG: nucleotide exchange factor GrpE [Planctomycetales bacterium]|nr:nucleotide exchange factor GrpE [Planctomycetales bacterium]